MHRANQQFKLGFPARKASATEDRGSAAVNRRPTITMPNKIKKVKKAKKKVSGKSAKGPKKAAPRAKKGAIRKGGRASTKKLVAIAAAKK